ncbi:MAG: succinate dehydrogenase assembly factor 2 [Gammaproteobacteria bacterium]|nr:succinate dehydrogenase assembly factor 2 [Gammaproteobacteria bacterium]MDH5694523.1 succinate dehydrogenase assembly factor 2 [Gammaproteobacteria bacterium]
MTTQRLPLNQLKWACRRGMLELDVLLDSFLENGYLLLSESEKDDFQDLLLYPDQELYDFFMNKQTPAEDKIARLIETIQRTAYSQNKALLYS